MGRIRIKVCGITARQYAFMAIDAGVDALGFIFAKSPRQVSPDEAKTITSALPPFVQTVGVFVNESSSRIMEIVDYCGLDLIQLHGDESPSLCASLMPRAIKAFQLKEEASVKDMVPYVGNVRAFLLDTYSEEKRGGTGRTFDWRLALLAKEHGTPIVLSGGLAPSNVEEALSTVRPFAIDINSGVEDAPGKKSRSLIREVVEAVRRAEDLRR